ncbi:MULTISPECIES: flagellar basal body-associated protein FliL [unclassified Actinotalea]|uniref:flagellar basal body-associated FliL family protein n=1 Tax=unclassified Actinotalea TaxID=2638618 RepID=UPI0015F6EED7|nr:MULTISPECIES: flagellar basal body-associated FliL family protein [unclassified Actinotalea]
MPTEQRIIASKTAKGASQRIGAPTVAAEEEPPQRSRKKLVLVLALLLALAGGAAWYLLLGPGAGEPAEVAEPAPVPGEVVTVEAVSINLAAGHYLRLGFALQLTEEVHEEVSTAHALDVAIDLFSGRTVEEVGSAEGRAALKDQLRHQLVEGYEGEVMDVYLTDYVTQ